MKFRITFKEPDQLVVPIDYVVRNVTWVWNHVADYKVKDPAIMR